MGRRGHKRKNSHVVIVTSDAVDIKTKQFRVRPWIVQFFVLLLSVALGLGIGFLIYEKDVLDAVASGDGVVVVQDEEEIARLEAENASLQSQIEELNSTIQILSETVNQKTESERILTEQIEQQFLPTVYPLTGAATEEAHEEGDPICVYKAKPGSMVVAAGSGTVYAVVDDGEYGHNVWIDHGNGYMTIYRNKGDVKVRQGEAVTQRSTIYLIEEDNTVFGYQMMKDGEYIDPMEMLDIPG